METFQVSVSDLSRSVGGRLGGGAVLFVLAAAVLKAVVVVLMVEVEC